MVGIVASLVGPAILLGKCIVVPIKRQFNYLCCFHSNIQDLRDEAKKLEDARDGLQMRVNTAANNAEEIVPQVKTWLEKANEFQVKMTGIESSIANIQSGLLAIKSLFSLSRKAKKTAEAAKELRDGCSFDPIAQPAPPVATAMIPLGSTYEFESRTRTEEDIVLTLRENKINMVGICGMGGVGKTTMATRVMNRVKEEGLLDETVMVVVSQQADLLNIQNEIAEQLNLKLEGGSILSRAHKLCTRLQGGKRILIVLDDVWDNLKLEDLGIPCQSGLIKGCTILLTSRDSKILKAMNVQKVRALEVLSEIEAWYLFKSSAGACIDDHNVHSVAQEIVKECKGLPIALVTVGVALKDEKNPNIWNHALDQLKSSNPIDMPEVLEDVYKPLRISYDLLKSESAKSLFLLCCLFPEDSNVSITNLTYFAMALRMLEGIRNLEQTRNSVWSLVEMLKSRFLLLDDDNFRETIKMHDVVPDVAIFIASKERRIINCSDCTWISSYHLGESSEFPEGLNPNLRLLLIDNFGNKDFKINDGFFEGTRELNVLSISNGSLRSLPHATKLLKNLQTLILNSCSFLENISVVGELVNLEIFICCFCESIMELPVELRGLHRLRLLEFSYCRELKTIAPGLISTLVGLEELKMLASFDQWEGEDKEGKERTNAGLKELESLSNLTCLEIEVADFTLAAEQIRLSPKIMKFDITIGGYHQVFRFSSTGFEKNLKLHLDRGITLGNWIHKFLRNVEYMCLQGEGSNKLELRQAQNVRSLTFKNCSTMKKLVTITTSSIDYGRCDTTTATLFSLLEFLDLSNLPNLEEICDVDGPIPNEGSRSNICFKNLKILRLVELSGLKHPLKSRNQNVDSNYNNLSSVYIEKCHSLRTLFSLSTVKNCLPQLETLEIMYCDKMEQVFLNEEENEKNIGQSCHIMIFPKLWRLRLKNLVNLIYFCKGIESIEFPQLAQMHIEDCPQLKSLVSTTSPTVCGLNDHDDDDADSLHLFCKPEKVAFGSLKKLHIDGYFTLILWCHQIPNDFFTRLQLLVIRSFGGIRSLFSSSVARNLVNLTELEIEYCREMVKVIEDDGEKYSHKTICLFLKLQILKLNHLPSLKTFCDWRCDFEFPSLEDVQIYQCPQMERFTLTSPSTPKLRTVGIDYECLKDQDLNGALQQHFLEKESFYKWEAKVKGVQSL